MDTGKTADYGIFGLLVTKNVPHVLEKIFFYLDYESYKTCLDVSNTWYKLLTSKTFQTKGKCVFEIEILKDHVYLLFAACKGKIEVARKVLSTGMLDVNDIESAEGNTPLHVAATFGNLEMVQLLLDSGAEKHPRNSFGETALYHAAARAHRDIVNLLIDQEEAFSLILAAERNAKNTLERLLLAGADPNMTNSRGFTPLTAGAYKGHAGVVKLLLESGAQPNKAMKYGDTPLHLAAKKGHIGMAKMLIEKGAVPNLTNIVGRTPLHAAAMRDNRETVKLLMDSGSDVNKADEWGETPLSYAIEKGFQDAVNIMTS